MRYLIYKIDKMKQNEQNESLLNECQKVKYNSTSIELKHDKICTFYSNCVDCGYKKYEDIDGEGLNCYLNKLSINILLKEWLWKTERLIIVCYKNKLAIINLFRKI